MTPLYLEMEAFGPYLQRQRVDFEALRCAGLFLIQGETGAGKTTILDAITYALYGKASGGARGDFTAMRCQRAPEDIQTEVIFDFEKSGQVYRFIRRLRVRRKRSGDTEFVPMQDAFYRTETGEFAPFFENPKQKRIEEKTVEIIGLEFDQFRQVVILPQGQFERLLVASSEDKEHILTTLFGVEQWDKAVLQMSDTINIQKKILDTLNAQLMALLSAYGVETGEQLAQKRAALQADYTTQQAVFTTLETRTEAAEKALTEGRAWAREFALLDETQEKLRTLQLQEEQYREKRTLLDCRELASSIQKLKTHEQEQDKTALAMQEWEKTLHTLQSQGLELTKQKEDLQAQRETQILAEARLPILQAEERAFSALAAQENALEARQKELIEAEHILKNLEAREQECVKKSRDCLESYLSQLSGELASRLQEGRPCPVCGSLSHPAPAGPAQGDATREQVTAVNRALEQAQKTVVQAAAEIQAKRQELTKQQTLLAEAGGYHAASHQTCKAALAALKAEADKRKRTESTLEKVQFALQKQAEQLQAAQRKQAETANALARLETAIEMLQSQIAQADPTGEGRAHLQRMPVRDFSALERELREYETALASAKETIRQQTEKVDKVARPELDMLENQAKALGKERLERRASLAVLEEEQKRMEADSEKLEKLQAEYTAQRAKYDADFAFVRLLRGSAGVSLQRYVLGAMLSAVTQEANRLLERVHEGRYQIYRTLDTAGGVRKAGLELAVLDRLAEARRPVSTLSGGEKFLVALALSIGLSSVVQAQSGGVRLGAIFIDEGFGTLDENSLNDALHVLASIRDSRGMVGIISHVGLLRESISAGIHVQKQREGSTLKVYGG